MSLGITYAYFNVSEYMLYVNSFENLHFSVNVSFSIISGIAVCTYNVYDEYIPRVAECCKYKPIEILSLLFRIPLPLLCIDDLTSFQ